MAKRRQPEKTQSQSSAPSKPTRQERRQAARNNAKARQTVETTSPLTMATSYSRQDALAFLALGLLVIVSYLPAMLWGGFVWDDNLYIKVDPVREVSGLQQIWFSPSAIEKRITTGHWSIRPSGWSTSCGGLHSGGLSHRQRAAALGEYAAAVASPTSVGGARRLGSGRGVCRASAARGVGGLGY